MTMATRGHGTAAIYGRVHNSVTELYAVMKNGERVDWPIYDDPRNAERYFAVIADSEALADIIAAAPTATTSLKQSFGIWFSQPPALAPAEAPGPWPLDGVPGQVRPVFLYPRLMTDRDGVRQAVLLDVVLRLPVR